MMYFENTLLASDDGAGSGTASDAAGPDAPLDGDLNMATYKQIVECVKLRTGRTVKTCWVAEVKRELGLTTRVAWNRGQGAGSPSCPPRYKEAIRHCIESTVVGRTDL